MRSAQIGIYPLVAGYERLEHEYIGHAKRY